MTLGIDLAIPCGLLLHELASNSLKHAFPDERSGEIFVEMREEENGGYRLCVGDNGAGFPPGLDYRQTPSLGLQLVNTLTEDLRGTIELDTRAGTVFTICFPGSSVTHASPAEAGPYRRP